ncbi:Transcription factor [Niveomyces insectorum RCEF 264]|uniref:Transcription factor n=1 Tax=Niveomyces insectorum RCEF 264 TaxID=1081102 RepID=A0A167XAJ5_9HYPO|nr:Transcription factor [Niveomyces insectorum RCEF 264]
MDSNRSTKRRRIQLACDPCRFRKTGCDGHRPYCTSCASRGWQDRCKYQEEPAPSSTLTLASLDRRLRRLETAAAAPRVQQVHVSSGTSSSDAVSLAPGSHSSETIPMIQTLVSSRSPCRPDDDLPHRASATSNLSFVQQVSAIVRSTNGQPADGREDARNCGTPFPMGFSVPYDDARERQHHSTMDLVLPTRPVADHLLGCYWDLVHPTMPLLHRPTFTAAYQRLWQPIADDATAARGERQIPSHDVLFHALLNMVLALGSHRNEGFAPAEREQQIRQFYQRSLALVSVESVDTSSLELVQLFLLRSLHLLYTPYADRCWATAGVAFRVAHALGLHLNSATAVLNQLDREMRRRVWHCCVLVDWMTSVSFDRTPALSAFSSVPRPALVDDEYLSTSGEGRQPPETPSRLAFFSSALDIMVMRENVRHRSEQSRSRSPSTAGTNHRGYSGSELGATVDAIADFDRFLMNLPDHLRTDRPQKTYGRENDQCFRLQAETLKARLMYIRLGVLRPLMVAGAKRWSSGGCGGDLDLSLAGPKQRLFMDLYGMCISTAHEALEWMHGRLEGVHRTSPWHTLYYTFAAATVLVAATLCSPPLKAALDDDPFKASWDRAMDIFAYHKGRVSSAEKGMEALETFKAYVAQQERGDQASTPFAAPSTIPVHSQGTPAVSNPSLFDVSFAEVPSQDWEDIVGVVPMDYAWFVSQGLFDQG